MRISATATSTASVVAPAADPYTKKNISSLLVKNTGSSVVYLQWTKEQNELTVANGFPLAPNEILAINRDETSGAIYGITASGTTELRISGD
jgi:hypothetical protein